MNSFQLISKQPWEENLNNNRARRKNKNITLPKNNLPHHHHKNSSHDIIFIPLSSSTHYINHFYLLYVCMYLCDVINNKKL